MQQAVKYSKDDILRKVKALLANAQDHQGKNEHLAAAFAVKAQQLMQSWNIQENELRTTENIIGFVEYHFKSKRKWQKFLLDAVCRTNFCKLVWSSRGDLAWIFGSEANILFCLELFRYLMAEILPLSEAAFMAYLCTAKSFREVVPRQSWNNNFYTGAVHMVGHRLHVQFEHAQGLAEQQRTAQDDDVDEVVGLIDVVDPAKMRALVVVQDKALDDKLAEVFPAVQKKNKYFNTGVHNDGYAEGLHAGAEVTLNKTLKASNGKGWN